MVFLGAIKEQGAWFCSERNVAAVAKLRSLMRDASPIWLCQHVRRPGSLFFLALVLSAPLVGLDRL